MDRRLFLGTLTLPCFAAGSREPDAAFLREARFADPGPRNELYRVFPGKDGHRAERARRWKGHRPPGSRRWRARRTPRPARHGRARHGGTRRAMSQDGSRASRGPTACSSGNLDYSDVATEKSYERRKFPRRSNCRSPTRLREPATGSSRIQSANLGGFRDSAHSEHVGRKTHIDSPVLMNFEDFLERRLHHAFQPIVNILRVPE